MSKADELKSNEIGSESGEIKSDKSDAKDAPKKVSGKKPKSKASGKKNPTGKAPAAAKSGNTKSGSEESELTFRVAVRFNKIAEVKAKNIIDAHREVKKLTIGSFDLTKDDISVLGSGQ